MFPFPTPSISTMVMGAAIVTLAIGLFITKNMLDSAETKLDQANVKIGKLTAEYTLTVNTLTNSITAQNKAIENYKQEAERANSLVDAQVTKSKDVRVASDRKVQTIMDRKPATNCDDSIKDMVLMAPQLNWSTK